MKHLNFLLKLSLLTLISSSFLVSNVVFASSESESESEDGTTTGNKQIINQHNAEWMGRVVRDTFDTNIGAVAEVIENNKEKYKKALVDNVYWAKSEKFSGSIENLSKLFTFVYCDPNLKIGKEAKYYRSVIENQNRGIVTALNTFNNSGESTNMNEVNKRLYKTDSGKRALSLVNGLVAFRTLYNFKTKITSGTVNTDLMERLFDDVFNTMKNDEWYTRVIEHFDNNEERFKKYIRHDWDCYFNQFFVLMGGKFENTDITSIANKVEQKLRDKKEDEERVDELVESVNDSGTESDGKEGVEIQNEEKSVENQPEYNNIDMDFSDDATLLPAINAAMKSLSLKEYKCIEDSKSVNIEKTEHYKQKVDKICKFFKTWFTDDQSIKKKRKRILDSIIEYWIESKSNLTQHFYPDFGTLLWHGIADCSAYDLPVNEHALNFRGERISKLTKTIWKTLFDKNDSATRNLLKTYRRSDLPYCRQLAAQIVMTLEKFEIDSDEICDQIPTMLNKLACYIDENKPNLTYSEMYFLLLVTIINKQFTKVDVSKQYYTTLIPYVSTASIICQYSTNYDDCFKYIVPGRILINLPNTFNGFCQYFRPFYLSSKNKRDHVFNIYKFLEHICELTSWFAYDHYQVITENLLVSTLMDMSEANFALDANDSDRRAAYVEQKLANQKSNCFPDFRFGGEDFCISIGPYVRAVLLSDNRDAQITMYRILSKWRNQFGLTTEFRVANDESVLFGNKGLEKKVKEKFKDVFISQ